MAGAKKKPVPYQKFAIPEGRVAKGYTFEVLVSPNSGYHPASRAGRVPLLI